MSVAFQQLKSLRPYRIFERTGIRLASKSSCQRSNRMDHSIEKKSRRRASSVGPDRFNPIARCARRLKVRAGRIRRGIL